MTLPDERYRAMKHGKQFLYDLIDPKKTPRVPKEIRRQALCILRHYPDEFHFEQIAEKLPEWFDTKPFMVRIQEKQDGQ
jgi:hypothetical protein